MKQRQHKPHGQVRRSQLLTTFGPGALIDLPKHSVLVGGLDDWRGNGTLLDEPRLLEKIRRFLPDIHELREPPIDPDPQRPTAGVTVWQFPEWFVTQDFVQGPLPAVGASASADARQARRRRQQEEKASGGSGAFCPRLSQGPYRRY